MSELFFIQIFKTGKILKKKNIEIEKYVYE